MRRRVIIVAAATLAVLAAARVAPRPALLDGVAFSHAVFDREGRLLRLTTAPDERYRVRTPLEAISPSLVEATLLKEDQQFWFHPGVNPLTLVKAAWQTYGSRGPRAGGSTITMQLARMVYRIDSRTVGGKLEQMARAAQLELLYSKREILEAYLNLAPYGGNVEGAGAASLVYFDKRADHLSLPEALTLAVMPQSPARRLTAARSAAPASDLVDAQRELFARWVRRHPKDADRKLIGAPVLRSAADLPFRAPHFVDAIVEANPTESMTRTTLDLELQALVERQVRGYVERKAALGIRNASVLLVDRVTMEVRAAVGSADFFDPAIQGQVNGTRARRSPGSALKPFIYALGIEQGLIHPASVLKDAPTSFNGYNPENFDGQFLGPVSATDALVRSRNIPAVEIASQLKDPTLYGLLQRAGVGQLREESSYGLSIVLGSAEVTLEELAELYAALGNGGVVRRLRPKLEAPEAAAVRILSAEAAWSVLWMLSQNPRPAEAQEGAFARNPLRVAWKTGTSHGYRDAWAVGLFGHYVLAVWIGNFDGEPNPAFVGVQAAGPLFFAVADAIRAAEPRLEDALPAPPSGVTQIEVCAVSGQLPGPHCAARKRTWFVPGRSPIHTCDVHREVLIDAASGLRACVTGPTTRAEVFEAWPSDLLKLFAQAGMPRRLPPPDGPTCAFGASASKGMAPRISSPQRGVTYNLRAGSVGTETIALTAVTDGDAREVFWFVDDKQVGRTASGEPFFWAAVPGRFTVRAVDDRGLADARALRVAVVK